MWVSSLKWIRAGSKEVEGLIGPVGRRLPICAVNEEYVFHLIWMLIVTILILNFE
jgi:hypothetical protein